MIAAVRLDTASAAERTSISPSVFLYVTEDRGPPGVENCEWRGHVGVGGDDHFVTRLDSGREQGKHQRRCPRGGPDAMAGAAEGGELGFEAVDFGPEDEASRGEHPVEGQPQLLAGRIVMPPQVHERDL